MKKIDFSNIYLCALSILTVTNTIHFEISQFNFVKKI